MSKLMLIEMGRDAKKTIETNRNWQFVEPETTAPALSKSLAFFNFSLLSLARNTAMALTHFVCTYLIMPTCSRGEREMFRATTGENN
jgi:hypothetical protein